MVFRSLLILLFSAVLVACSPAGMQSTELELSDTPTYGSFIWHDLITDDVSAAKAFYGPLMGWSFEKSTRPDGGAYTLITSSDGNYVGGMVELDDPADGEDYSRWLPYYAVPNVDRAVADMVKAGGEVIVEAKDLGDVARVAAVQDPDGALVGLITSRVGYPVDRLKVGNGEISWNDLLAAKPSETAAVYASLGRGEVTEQARGEYTYYQILATGRNRAGVMMLPNDSVEPLWLTYFAADDVNEVLGKVSGLGGEVLLASDPEVRNGTIGLAQDPTGAVFGVQAQQEAGR